MQALPEGAQIIGLAPGNVFTDDRYLDHISLIFKETNSTIIAGTLDLPGQSFNYPSADDYSKDPIHEIDAMLFKLDKYRKFRDI